MKMIPAISILNGRVAMVEDGRYSYLKNPEGQYRSPVNVVRELDFPGDEVFILDINGLERDHPNLDAVKRMAAHAEVWLDAGTTDADSMMDLFISDASRVVMGTKSISGLKELKEAVDLSDSVIFSIDYNRKIVGPDPKLANISLEALLNEVNNYQGLKAAMLMDLGSLMTKTPVDLDMISKISGAFEELYVSAYLPDEDIVRLEELGVTGIIIDFRKLGGMYSGRA